MYKNLCFGLILFWDKEREQGQCAPFEVQISGLYEYAYFRENSFLPFFPGISYAGMSNLFFQF